MLANQSVRDKVATFEGFHFQQPSCNFWPGFLERSITLSTGSITIQSIALTLIHCIAIYPVDSVI